jgi:hypothetical protein
LPEAKEKEIEIPLKNTGVLIDEKVHSFKEHQNIRKKVETFWKQRVSFFVS